MIRVNRGAEPAALAKLRSSELARVRGIAATRKPTSDDIGTKYAVAHDALWRAQHFKCCYCEHSEFSKRNDVEHFRPKARANRNPGVVEDHGYWWLTWNWENLLFSCRNCNQAPAKLDKFPLDVGSEALLPEQSPPGKERPLLIDPASESGIDHIRFVWTVMGLATTGKWLPTPRSGSPKGEWTIRVCQLDRPDLLDLYGRHVELNVKPRVEDILDAIQRGNPLEIHRQWKRARLSLLNPQQEYVGLAHDALDHFVPEAIRSAHGLVLSLP